MNHSLLVGALAAFSVVLAAVIIRRAVNMSIELTTRARLYGRDEQLAVAHKHSITRAVVVCGMVALPATIALSGALVPAGIVAVLELVAFGVLRQVLRARASERYERSIPLVLDQMTRSVRSGSGIIAALREASTSVSGDVGDDIGRVVKEAAHGQRISTSLMAWSERRPTRTVRLCAGALSLAIETGAAQAQAIDSAAATVRQALNAVSTTRSHATQARASAATLTVLPLLVSGPVLIVSSHAQHFMFATGLGNAILIAGLVLDAIGAMWMSYLIKRTLS